MSEIKLTSIPFTARFLETKHTEKPPTKTPQTNPLSTGCWNVTHCNFSITTKKISFGQHSFTQFQGAFSNSSEDVSFSLSDTETFYEVLDTRVTAAWWDCEEHVWWHQAEKITDFQSNFGVWSYHQSFSLNLPLSKKDSDVPKVYGI